MSGCRTDKQLASYLAQTWLPGASAADIAKVLQLYPSDPAAGSPFNTGNANAFTPQYKRIAAIQGDLFFNAPRRQLLDRFSSHRAMYNFRKCCVSSVFVVSLMRCLRSPSERTR